MCTKGVDFQHCEVKECFLHLYQLNLSLCGFDDQKNKENTLKRLDTCKQWKSETNKKIL